jgi:hypothetical protein
MHKVMKYFYPSGLIHYFGLHSTVATLVNYSRSFTIIAATLSHIKRCFQKTRLSVEYMSQNWNIGDDAVIGPVSKYYSVHKGYCS